LSAGDHTFGVAHFQGGGGMRLKIEWKRPDDADFSLMGGDDVLIDPGLTPVVSAGPKKLARDSALSRPGDGWPVEGVHPGWKVTTLHSPDFSPKVSAMAFAPDGKLLVATFDPPDGKSPLPDPRVTGEIYAFDRIRRLMARRSSPRASQTSSSNRKACACRTGGCSSRSASS
jgi:hypothetical protein